MYYEVLNLNDRWRQLYRYNEETGRNEWIREMAIYNSRTPMYQTSETLFYFDSNSLLRVSPTNPQQLVMDGDAQSPVQREFRFLFSRGADLYFSTEWLTRGTSSTILWKVTGRGALSEVIRLESNTINSIREAGGLVYFSTGSGELWRSDGTTEGTFPVSSLRAIRLFPAQEGLVFGATHPELGFEWWFTDGTVEGTRFLKDINPGEPGSGTSSGGGFNGADSIVFKGDVWFRANSALLGTELYRTDGTPEGTRLVGDLNPVNLRTRPRYLQSLNGQLYFLALGHNHSFDNPLYVSDGTLAGTVQLTDEADSRPLTSWGGLTWFHWDNGLARTDGSLEGTFSFPVRSQFFDPVQLEDGTALFTQGSCCTFSLWQTDGTVEGTGPLERNEKVTDSLATNSTRSGLSCRANQTRRTSVFPEAFSETALSTVGTTANLWRLIWS